MNEAWSEPMKWAWLAGLFEGEGWFTVDHTPGRRPQFRAGLGSTDEDVVRFAQAIVGVGQVAGPRPSYTGKNKRRVKDRWDWRVGARAEALYLARCLYPLLGERRQERLRALLAEVGATVSEA